MIMVIFIYTKSGEMESQWFMLADWTNWYQNTFMTLCYTVLYTDQVFT